MSKSFSFPNVGTCSKQTNIVLNDDHTIESVEVIGGCNGNLKGISRLLKGLKAEDAIARMVRFFFFVGQRDLSSLRAAGDVKPHRHCFAMPRAPLLGGLSPQATGGLSPKALTERVDTNR